ncbi:RNA-directed RNA polymerase 2 [Collybia nuda]|uniref:RNA-dependent RNA polymerase n=1 Tax=Collybia nuda TaxID=64659 RepID=A0A9P6CEM9_9AGAR|nr:RNA-directed RNA polymerase 2 [Collybia nuda]
MEVFMYNISFSATNNEVTSRLADILHNPPYTNNASSLALNFDTRLFKDKRGRRMHSGNGALTLPSPEIAIQFLAEYGEYSPPLKSCFAGGRRIKFIQSKNLARPDILASIQRRPYIEPKIREERERREAILASETVSIRTIQFGWECRDSIFSIEWEKDFPGSVLSFDSERRELRISLSHQPNTLTIAIRLSHILYASAHIYISEKPVIFLSLEIPPVFAKETTPLRQRLSALPIADHARVVPYTSLALRIECTSYYDLEKFRELSKATQFYRIFDLQYAIDRRGLFSAPAIAEFERAVQLYPWSVAFQLVGLVRHMLLDVKEMLGLIPHITQLVIAKGKDYTSLMLQHFGTRARTFLWAPDDVEEKNIEECFGLAKNDFDITQRSPKLRPTNGSLFDSLHVTITPTTIFLEGPFQERSNRVVRRYDRLHHESFLRVSFVDEGHLQYRFDREIDGPDFIRRRVGDYLLNGLNIAQRLFEFLAYSQSALKEHTVWFVKPFRDHQHGYVDAPRIIKGLGSFENVATDESLIFCPARYAARLSQAFTATDTSVSVEVEEIIYIEDVLIDNSNDSSSKYCFTDGVGTMSRELAIEISQALKSKRRRTYHKRYTAALQVRFMGSKGMLSVDYRLQGRAICIRPSMNKFNAPDTRDIEIARAFDRPGPYFLNRPLIMLLEGLGIGYDVFKELQDRAVQETQRSTESFPEFARLLERHGLGSSFRLTSAILNLEKLGMDNLHVNPFHKRMMDCAIYHILRLLKNHARIPVPDAWTLVGVADVHRYLMEGEIFACIQSTEGIKAYLEGPVLISRSPTIHPGDVQVATAIGAPPPGSCFFEEGLTNTVVFSILGARPLPSCLGGGDLDGDVYNVVPLNKAPNFRPSKTYEPAEYKPAQKKTLSRPSTMRDVAEFVMEYINSDVVGIIAINWLILADQSPRGIFDDNCIKLASLHSDAVDYPKSGQPVPLSGIPKLLLRERPDWNAPETINPDPSKGYYLSKCAIGRLFRDIDLPNIPSSSSERVWKNSRVKATDELVTSFAHVNLVEEGESPISQILRNYLSEFIDTSKVAPEEMINVRQIFRRYTSELQAICHANTLSQWRCLSEEEAMIGTILQKTSQPRKRKDAMAKLREQTDILVGGVREELIDDDDTPFQIRLERAWVAWELSLLQAQAFGGQSFGWVALGAIFELIKEREEIEFQKTRGRLR